MIWKEIRYTHETGGFCFPVFTLEIFNESTAFTSELIQVSPTTLTSFNTRNSELNRYIPITLTSPVMYVIRN